jgi:2-oxoglutarate/2-oxoacid ferredoxin oxidoreductase subunit beta
MTDIPLEDIQYTRKDFVSDQTVRWCPGCGDYAILAAMQKTLPDLNVRKENIVFISGIGCSSRFPYYMNTYGIHSIHGRAPTLATGLKIVNPELQVWVITGDGDGLSIGGNHLLHACRRNIDLNIVLFNNRIYGLTKGQYSPTSLPGTKTKSSPMGSIEHSFNPVAVTLGAEATFIARSIDTNTRHMGEVLKSGAEHKGTTFIEILQNCVIFNDGTWSHASDKSHAADNAIYLEHGQPMIFGKSLDKGIRLDSCFLPEVVHLGDGITENDLLVHDQTNRNLAFMLAHLDFPDFPVPMGVIYRVAEPSYEEQLMAQVHEAQENQGTGDLRALYHADYTWEVEADQAQTIATVKPGHHVMTEHNSLEEAYMDAMVTDTTEDDSLIREGLASDPIANLLHKRPLIATSPNTPLADALDLMEKTNIDGLLIVDEDTKPLGIFTAADVLRRVAIQVEDLTTQPISDFMTANPDVLQVDEPIAHALNMMAVHHYRHVPIVDEKGIALNTISFRDVVHYIEAYFDKA